MFPTILTVLAAIQLGLLVQQVCLCKSKSICRSGYSEGRTGMPVLWFMKSMMGHMVYHWTVWDRARSYSRLKTTAAMKPFATCQANVDTIRACSITLCLGQNKVSCRMMKVCRITSNGWPLSSVQTHLLQRKMQQSKGCSCSCRQNHKGADPLCRAGTWQADRSACGMLTNNCIAYTGGRLQADREI